MNGIVNWYSDRKKHGLIEGEDGKEVMVYDRDLPFLTILHAGDHVEYSTIKTIDGFKATKIKQILK